LPNLPINLIGIYYLAIKYAKQLFKMWHTQKHTHIKNQGRGQGGATITRPTVPVATINRKLKTEHRKQKTAAATGIITFEMTANKQKILRSQEERAAGQGRSRNTLQ